MRKTSAADRTRIATPVEGGWVTRDEASGRMVSVEGSSGVSVPRPKSEEIVKDASSKRREALKRLVDR